ncbi:TonB-dependent receptor [Sphingomonas colocasiae]|uniref:TonB-dependent receptor n=1 Tax=Sphingomonas colocasiae TaxID=1848973 RepID=A0ABS7PW45_9SPHN|nr:TonB-dependent receptor [Sphingomonas colocasiae]MBY8825581.1 TonB-dependent receptor [Sphingomonas colocasiae]
MTTEFTRTLRVVLFASTVLGMSGVAAAQEQAEPSDDIVVTATKMGETALQKTPIAITAFNSASLERSIVNNARDLVQLVPSLSIAQNNAYAQIYIRGIGSNNVFNGSDPSSTVHIDGVYISRPFSQFANFLDVERVEVLRGPQGTLYGRNSVGGTINIISRAPTNETEAKVQLTGGNYALAQIEAYVSGALVSDKLMASLSGMYARRDGYRKNVVAGVGNVDDEDLVSIRGQLRKELIDGVSATTRVDYMSQSNAALGYGKLLLPYDPVTDSILGDYKKVAHNIPTDSNVRAFGISEDIAIELSDSLTLKSLTAYRRNRFSLRTDSDASDRNILISNLSERQRQFSQEFNLSGKAGRLTYLAGLYYIHETNQTGNRIEARVPGTETQSSPRVVTDAFAVYGQLNYAVTDRLTATAGLRYTDEKKDIAQNLRVVTAATQLPVAGYPIIYSKSSSFKAWTPKFGLDFQATDDVLVYASATRGFKSGGFNVSSSDPNQGFSPEFLWSYEGGLKAELFDRSLRVRIAGFYYDYSDLQVQAFSRPGFVDITNAATARVKGLEIETLWRPAPALSIGANLSVLDAKYRSYFAPVAGVLVDYSGNRLNSAPRYSVNLSAQYDIPTGVGPLSPRIEYARFGQQYFTAANTALLGQDGYDVFNASLTFAPEGSRWRASLWAKNIGDAQYVTTTATFTAVASGRPGEPRTFGARLSWTY